MIKVLSQGQNNQWQEFTTEIENTGSPTELLTHAAMCPEKIADKSTQEQGVYSLRYSGTQLTDDDKKALYSSLRTIVTRSFESIG